jgi:hypothetical protein
MHFEGDCTRVLSVFAITSQQGITYNWSKPQAQCLCTTVYMDLRFICWTLTVHGLRLHKRKNEAFCIWRTQEWRPWRGTYCVHLRGTPRKKQTASNMCENDNEPSGSLKGAEFLDQLKDHQLLKWNISHGTYWTTASVV